MAALKAKCCSLRLSSNVSLNRCERSRACRPARAHRTADSWQRKPQHVAGVQSFAAVVAARLLLREDKQEAVAGDGLIGSVEAGVRASSAHRPVAAHRDASPASTLHNCIRSPFRAAIKCSAAVACGLSLRAACTSAPRMLLVYPFRRHPRERSFRSRIFRTVECSGVRASSESACSSDISSLASRRS
jgi:hypothetical protein